MYGSNLTKASAAVACQQAQPQTGAAIGSATASQSEIEFELQGLHGVLERLALIKNDLRQRLAPVSASLPDTGMSASEGPAMPSSDVARSIRGAGQRVHSLCQELEEAIALLRC